MTRLLRPKECATTIGVSIATFWRLLRRPGVNFPVPFRMSANAVGFDELEVMAWRDARRDPREPRIESKNGDAPAPRVSRAHARRTPARPRRRPS